jgi:hypothetical protein
LSHSANPKYLRSTPVFPWLSTHTKLPGEFLPRCRHPAGHG